MAEAISPTTGVKGHPVLREKATPGFTRSRATRAAPGGALREAPQLSGPATRPSRCGSHYRGIVPPERQAA